MLELYIVISVIFIWLAGFGSGLVVGLRGQLTEASKPRVKTSDLYPRDRK